MSATLLHHLPGLDLRGALNRGDVEPDVRSAIAEAPTSDQGVHDRQSPATGAHRYRRLGLIENLPETENLPERRGGSFSDPAREPRVCARTSWDFRLVRLG
jgi:hypothetical protein